jgi:cell division septation protein DedD
MSRDDQRIRVPTSDELEQLGALAPAAAAGAAPSRRGRMLRFFRASRIRVPADVAARKHIGTVQAHRPEAQLPGTTAPAGQTAEAERMLSASAAGPVPEPHRPPDALEPRKIQMDPSVRERRGLGRSNDARKPGG